MESAFGGLAHALFVWLCEQGGTASFDQAQAHGERLGCRDGTFARLIGRLDALFLVVDHLHKEPRAKHLSRHLSIPSEIYAAVRHDVVQRLLDEQAHALVAVDVADPAPDGAAGSPTVPGDGEPLLLYDLATIVGASYQQDIVPTRADTIPKRVAAKLRPLLRGMPRFHESATPQRGSTLRLPAAPYDSAERELAAVAGEESFDPRRLPPLPDGQPGREDGYLDYLFHAARSLELLDLRAPPGTDQPCYQPGPAFDPWTAAPVAVQAARFLGWWRAAPTWLDPWPPRWPADPDIGQVEDLYSGRSQWAWPVYVVAQVVHADGNVYDVDPRVSLARNGTAGHPLTARAISHLCEQRMGTSKVHALRHTFARALEDAGAKVSEIQAALGHADLGTTGRYLARLHQGENRHLARLSSLYGLSGLEQRTASTGSTGSGTDAGSEAGSEAGTDAAAG